MKWDTDRIVAVCAMLVGLGSLFIVLYQTKLISEQQKASVLPYLMITYNSGNDGAWLALRNVGLGPARIERISVRRGGSAFDGDPYAYYATLPDMKVPADHVYRDRVLPGMLIPSGSLWQMLGSPNPQPMAGELLRTFAFVAIQDPVPSHGPSADSPAAPTLGADQSSGASTPPAEKAVLEIDYTSVYGERWRIRSDRVVPERL
jgi:hypothetical protein